MISQANMSKYGKLQLSFKKLHHTRTHCKAQNKNTIVSGDAGDEKNLHPGGLLHLKNYSNSTFLC